MSAAAPDASARSGPPSTLGSVPGSWMQAILMSRYQFRDFLRSRRFLLMVGIVGAIGSILLSLVGYYRPATLLANSNTFYANLWVGGAELLIIFAGIIFGGDAIAGEFQNKTGYYLMSHPIKRWSVYAGKFLASYAAALVTISAYFLILVGAGGYFFGTGALTAGLLGSYGLAILYLGGLLGVTFLFSALFKTSLYGVIIVAVMFLFGFSIINALFEGLVGLQPWFIITWANEAISYPLTGAPHTAGLLVPKAYVPPTLAQGIAVMAGYLVFTTLGGLWLFEREEFT